MWYVCWGVWQYERFEEESDEPHRKLFYIMFPIPLLFLLLSALLTILFLHLDDLCCCCPCTAEPGEELSVYDPDTDRVLELAESPQEDVERQDSDLPLMFNTSSMAVPTESLLPGQTDSGSIASSKEKPT